MPSIRPPTKITKAIRDDHLDKIAQSILDSSSKVALWIMAISTLVLALPVLWSILQWMVRVADKN
jgi:hypothetical protein